MGPAMPLSPDAVSATGGQSSVRFGIVLPVHNEEQLVPAALAALDRAVGHVSSASVDVGIAIVLDACTDQSQKLITRWKDSVSRAWSGPIDVIETTVGNVGQARRIGFEKLLRRWSGVGMRNTWLATTDADSEVPRDWISSQLAVRSEGGQVWAGGVIVNDWSGREAGTAERWREHDQAEHQPIHGANFGIEAALYVEAGGFDGLRTGEDRDLFERSVALGAVVRHDPAVRVVTSSRRQARAPHGFAYALSCLESLPPSVNEAAQFPAAAMAQPATSPVAGVGT